jgi:hypothetical protein
MNFVDKQGEAATGHLEEYLIIEAEILGLIGELVIRLGEHTFHKPKCQYETTIKAAYETLGKAQAAMAGVLPIWDTDWDLYSTKKSLKDSLEYCNLNCKTEE